VVLAVLGLTVVVAAILSSYASALGNPSPRRLPVAVSAPPAVLGQLEAAPQLRVYPVPDLAQARVMVEDRTVYGRWYFLGLGRSPCWWPTAAVTRS
jgi:hypothetical protein